MAKENIIGTRWETEDGKDRLKRIVEAIQKGDRNWPEILKGFPGVDELGSGGLMSGRDLRGVILTECDLSGANFFSTCFTGANLCGSNLDRACLSYANLSQANFNSVSLAKANLTYAHLNGAWFMNANLKGANLYGSKLNHANFNHADIRGARFCGSMLCKTWFGMGMGGEISGDVNFRGVKFNRSTLFLETDISRNNWAGNPLLKRHIEDQQWLDVWRNRSWINKYLLHPIWLLSCDCGRSFILWACWSLALAIGFGFLFANCASSFNLTAFDGKTLADAHGFMPFYYSIVTFTTLGFGDVVPNSDNGIMQFCVTLEVVLGYIMLGGLISILANKLARRA